MSLSDKFFSLINNFPIQRKPQQRRLLGEVEVRRQIWFYRFCSSLLKEKR